MARSAYLRDRLIRISNVFAGGQELLICGLRVRFPPGSPHISNDLRHVPDSPQSRPVASGLRMVARRRVDRQPRDSHGHEVAVNVDRDLNRAVADLLLHNTRGSGLVEAATMRRPDIVESDPSQLRFFKNPIEHVTHVRFVKQRLVGWWKHLLRLVNDVAERQDEPTRGKPRFSPTTTSVLDARVVTAPGWLQLTHGAKSLVERRLHQNRCPRRPSLQS